MSDSEWERIGAMIDAAVEGRAASPRTDTDLREQAKQAITSYVFGSKNNIPFGDDFTEPWGGIADAVLTVADPIIRAKVIEELAQRAEEHGYWVMSHSPGVQTKRASIWLRAQE